LKTDRVKTPKIKNHSPKMSEGFVKVNVSFCEKETLDLPTENDNDDDTPIP
jgi:hypothetical protein